MMMDRRSMLGALAALLLTPTGATIARPSGGAPGAGSRGAFSGAAALDRLLAGWPYGVSVRVLGDRLRTAGLVEAAAPALRRALLNALSADRQAIGAIAARTLEARLAAAISDDFAAGRTVVVDGWMLSRTEARLYALATVVPANLAAGDRGTTDGGRAAVRAA